MKKIILLLCFVFIYQYSFAEIIRVWYCPDGSVKVTSVSKKSKLPGETDEQHRQRIFTNTGIANGWESYPYDDIDSSELPDADIYFSKGLNHPYFNMWEGEPGKKVKINQQKVKEINDKKQKDIQDKQGAVNKLKALGLSEDEIAAIKK
jgi:hypothetical protein